MRQLIVIESTDRGLVGAAAGLAAVLAGRATVFAPLPAVAPGARSAAEPPAVVVVDVPGGVADVPGEAAAELAAWVARYVEGVPAAEVVCTSGARSVRVTAA